MDEIRDQIDFLRVSSAGKFDEMADTMEKLLASHIAADKVFVLHAVGLNDAKHWATLSDALDAVNIIAVKDQ